jgi:hypothetical protein
LIGYLFPEFFAEACDYSEGKCATSIPMTVFIILCIVMSVFAFIKNLSLIPLLGLISCCYLLTGMTLNNWKWFSIWLIIGLIIYFCYGFKKSKLAGKN